MSGMLVSPRDSRRIEAALRYYENLVHGQKNTPQASKRFFQQLPFRQFRLLGAARPPGGIESPNSVEAQPFLGDKRPELAWTDEKDEHGERIPVSETIYHHIPGMYLCKGTVVWCLWAYSEWRIIHAEQWPVAVHQIEADGFPQGTVTCFLSIQAPDSKESVEHTFQISTTASAQQLVGEIRKHPLLEHRKQDVQVSGGPLPYCAINIMYGPSLSGYEISPLIPDNGSLPAGRGLKTRILSPLWAVQ